MWVEAPDLFGSVENNESRFKNGIAFFGNLRFKTSTGRGNRVDLTIHIETEPKTVLCCTKFLKVTRDGPRIRKKKMISDSFSVDESHQSSSVHENDCDSLMDTSDSLDEHSVFNQLNIPRDKYDKYIQDLNEFTRNFVDYNEKIGQVLTMDDINQIIHQVSFKMIKNLCKKQMS
ncbi:runt-related transcription factor 3-like [Brachionus plicatilis]|uniref:Runt-related transcription factor 3-like n=1 Tax=Brachionus plicatilis TaxID=10195 RepID=A0A3M7QJ85_BRAPC|nr:runt-related transcription factor 3-like [Brachionus plicatilis]